MTATKLSGVQAVLCRIFPGGRDTRPLTMSEHGQLNDVVTAVLISISDGVFPPLDDIVVLGWFKDLCEMGVLSTANRQRLTRCETHVRAEVKVHAPDPGATVNPLTTVRSLMRKIDELQHELDDANEQIEQLTQG